MQPRRGWHPAWLCLQQLGIPTASPDPQLSVPRGGAGAVAAHAVGCVALPPLPKGTRLLWEGTHLNTEPQGFLGATEQRAEPAQCTHGPHGGEGSPRLALLGPDTCRVGTLPGPDTVINVLMAAKPLRKHALISDTGEICRHLRTCLRIRGGRATIIRRYGLRLRYFFQKISRY